MDLPVIGPSNRFLIPQRDRHWPQVLSALIGMSVLVVATLALVGWPRLRSTSIHYELIRLRAEVEELIASDQDAGSFLQVNNPGIQLAFHLAFEVQGFSLDGAGDNAMLANGQRAADNIAFDNTIQLDFAGRRDIADDADIRADQ